MFRNTHVTWLRRFKAWGRVTSVSRRGIPAHSAFDWQAQEQITHLHICLNRAPTKYKSGVNASSLRMTTRCRLLCHAVSEQYLRMTTRCHRRDGCRNVSTHLLRLLQCFTKPRSPYHQFMLVKWITVQSFTISRSHLSITRCKESTEGERSD